MAIRFVDLGSEGVSEARQPAATREARCEDMPAGDAEVRLPLAKPEPKQRGRKKPLR